jgi:hypothetical protein
MSQKSMEIKLDLEELIDIIIKSELGDKWKPARWNQINISALDGEEIDTDNIGTIIISAEPKEND